MTPSRKKQKISDSPTVRLSMGVENYLLSIFQLGEQNRRVTLTELSDQLKRLPEGEGLGTSLPSVGAMVRRMARESLVEITMDKEVVLTLRGRRVAESMVRRHRLAERMVVDLLGLELHKSHVEAHRLEHAISQDLEKKIIDRLGNPTTCPFGHPIPGSGYVQPKNLMALSTVPEGSKVVVRSVPEDDAMLLEFLVNNALIPGESIAIKETASYRGVITLLCMGEDVVVGYEVATRIWVTDSGQ